MSSVKSDPSGESSGESIYVNGTNFTIRDVEGRPIIPARIIPGAEAPYMMCVEGFFASELLNEGSSMRRRMSTLLDLADGEIANLVDVKARWDVFQVASARSLEARVRPSSGPVDAISFRQEQQSYRRSLMMNLADSLSRYLEGLSANRSRAFKAFIRETCSETTFIDSEESYDPETELLFFDFELAIGGEAND